MSGMSAAARACLLRLANISHPVVLVTLVARQGSTPQDIGARMLVDATGRLEGTIGGGKLERRVIDEARAWLLTLPGAPDAVPCLLHEWNLQRDIGMTCGGVATLLFEAHHVAPWRVVVFGAGHVAQALVRTLQGLDCSVVCIDSRPEWLAQLPESPALSAIALDDPSMWAAFVQDHDAVLCMTMGHATDVPILRALHAAGRQPSFLGVIGSDAKRKMLVKQLRADGVRDAWLSRLQCPVGFPIGGNQPGEIAVSVAAALLAHRHGQSWPTT
ncbi:XdhC family protein [Gemmatimonas sp.]